MVNKNRLRAQWRKAGRKYYTNIKNNRPKMYLHTISKNTKHTYKYRFGENYQLILERDNRKCRICFSEKRIVVHHIDGKGRNVPTKERNNSLDNLIVLCQSCHMGIQNFAKLRNNVLAKDLMNKFPIE